MAIRNKLKSSALIILCLILILIFSTSRVGFCDEKLNISVANPWLALLASFIGGPEVNVIPLRIWNSNGDLVIAENGKTLRELDNEAKIIALDEKDAKDCGINGKNNFNIKYLYSSFPIEKASISDPSVIPFVAQRILTALSEWDAQNYPYYQRRLAEFQARMSGSVLVGQVLKDITVCNMGYSCGILLQAAGCKIETPENLENWQNWQKGNFSGLRDYIEEKRAQGIIVIFDDDTPPALKKYLSGRSDVYHWKRPPFDTDYPTFLHEQYISLWQKITAKSLPTQKKNN